MAEQQYEDTLNHQENGDVEILEDQEEIDTLEEQEEIDMLEEQRMQRRRERMAVMRRKKRQQEIFRKWALVIVAALVLLILLVWGIARLAEGRGAGNAPFGESSQERDSEMNMQQETGEGENSGSSVQVNGEGIQEGAESDQIGESEADQPGIEQPVPEPVIFQPRSTEHTTGFPQEGRGVYSTHGILIDVEKEEILVRQNPYERISPASMTKILTLLVAAEHVTDLQDTFTITREITDYAFRHDCSIVGFEVGEVVTVEDLLYGTILPSGADAAVGLAEYVAGSQEAFVELMNEKLEELGLSDSAHFTNCVGLYDANHYCSVYDMAMLLKAASDNELCREVLSAHTYTTSATAQHPEGILVSNWFLRRIEDKDTHGEVLCAKTGFVNQSGSCAASLATDHEGREYLCVTAGSISSWACIYDHVEIYQAFLPEE